MVSFLSYLICASRWFERYEWRGEGAPEEEQYGDTGKQGRTGFLAFTIQSGMLPPVLLPV
jgi:hypothetical protein